MYETDLQMRLRDLNTAHHVDNLEVMRVAHEARILFLGGAEGVRDEPLGMLKNMPSEVMILVAAQHAEFRAQIRWQPGASYRVRSWVGHVGTSSFTVESEIRTERSEPDAGHRGHRGPARSAHRTAVAALRGGAPRTRATPRVPPHASAAAGVRPVPRSTAGRPRHARDFARGLHLWETGPLHSADDGPRHRGSAARMRPGGTPYRQSTTERG